MLLKVEFAARLDREQTFRLGAAVGLHDSRISAYGNQRPFFGTAEGAANPLVDIPVDDAVCETPIGNLVRFNKRVEFG